MLACPELGQAETVHLFVNRHQLIVWAFSYYHVDQPNSRVLGVQASLIYLNAYCSINFALAMNAAL